MKKLLIATACSAAVASSALAATQGALGATSSGDFVVTLTVAEQVRVSNIADISLDNGSGNIYVAGGGDLSGSTPLCVYYNNGSNVDLTIGSTNGTGSFLLDDGSGNQVTYAINISTNGDDATYEVSGFAEGTVQAITNADSSANDDCATAGANTQRLEAVVTDTGTQLGVPNGTYTDTVTIVAAPTP